MYSTKRNCAVGSLQGHKRTVTCVCWAPQTEDTVAVTGVSHRILFTGAADGEITMWLVDTSDAWQSRSLCSFRRVGFLAAFPRGYSIFVAKTEHTVHPHTDFSG